MKKIGIILVVVISVFAISVSFAVAQGCKIGIVDMDKFQQNSTAFQKIRLQLEKKFSELKKKLDAQKEEVIKLEEELRKQSLMLSLDAKEDRQRELQKKKRYYQYLANEFNQEMQQAKEDARRIVGKDLEKIVGEIGDKEGYTLILEKGTIGLMYYKDSIDITDQVIAAYDKLKEGK